LFISTFYSLQHANPLEESSCNIQYNQSPLLTATGTHKDKEERDAHAVLHFKKKMKTLA
jgi:hypothetical protein